MKKRFISLLLCTLILLAVLLTGCASESSNGVKSYTDAKNAVVVVEERLGSAAYGMDDAATYGSGFFIGHPGKDPEYVLTNHHVIEDYLAWDAGEPFKYQLDDGTVINTGVKVYVRVFFDSEDYVNAYVVAYDEHRDLALLRIEKPTNKRVPLAIEVPTEDMVGAPVYALGYPGLADDSYVIDPTSKWGISDVSITSGLISRFVTVGGTGVRRIQTDTDIWHGNSGGPMVTAEGNAIGISTRYEFQDDGNRVESTQYGISAVEIVELLDKNNISYYKIDPNDPNTDTESDFPVVPVVIAAAVLLVVIVAVIIIVATRKPKTPVNPPVTPPVLVDPPHPRNDDSGFRVQGTSGALSGKRVYVSTKQPLVIGRDRSACNMVVPENTPGVSRQHCAVSFKNGKLYIEDLGSTHGTFIAPGRKLMAKEPIEIHSGDTFYLGTPKESFVIDVKKG